MADAPMVSRPFFAGVAARMLDQHGVAAIWIMHEAAAKAYRAGNVKAAAVLSDVADAAEQEWERRSARARVTIDDQLKIEP